MSVDNPRPCPGGAARRVGPAVAPALRGLLAAVVLLVGASWLVAPTAWSHVVIVSSTPTEGDHLDALPRTVTLTFSGLLEDKAEVTVMGPDGSPRQTGATTVSGETVTQRLDKQGDTTGLYTIAYSATSEDGHVVSGQMGFYVGVDETGEDVGSGPTPAQEPPGFVDRDAEDDSGVPGAVWFALAVVVLLLAGLGLWVLRRRQTAPAAPAAPTTPPVPPRARARGEGTTSRSKRR